MCARAGRAAGPRPVRTGGTGWRAAPAPAAAPTAPADAADEAVDRDATAAAARRRADVRGAARDDAEGKLGRACGLEDLKLELSAIASEDDGGLRSSERVILLYGPPGCGKMLRCVCSRGTHACAPPREGTSHASLSTHTRRAGAVVAAAWGSGRLVTARRRELYGRQRSARALAAARRVYDRAARAAVRAAIKGA